MGFFDRLARVFSSTDSTSEEEATPVTDVQRDLRETSGALIPVLPSTPNRRVFDDLIVTQASIWDVPAVIGALDQMDLGIFQPASLLTDFALRDDRIQSASQTRVLGLQSVPFEMLPAGDDDSKPSRDAIEVAEAAKEDWQWIFPEEAHAQLMAWSIPMGFGLNEIVWDTLNGKGRWLPILKPWHPQYIYYNLGTRKYVALTGEGPIDVEPGNGKWFLYAPWGEYRGWIHGAIRALAIPFLLRQYAYRDWARFDEIHGLPIKGAIVPPNASQADKNNFFRQVAALAAKGAILLPQGDSNYKFDLKLISPENDNSWEAFKGLIDQCNSSINFTILGQNMSGGDQKGGGFSQDALVADGVRSDFKRADAASISRQIRSQVLRAWTKYNFGDERLTPRPRWDAEPPEDKEKKSKIYKMVADGTEVFVNLGFNVDQDKLVQDYELPITPGALLTPTTKAPAVPGDPGDPAAMSQRRATKPLTRTEMLAAGQVYVDTVADRGARLGTEAVQPVVSTVLECLHRARSYEELKTLLLFAFRDAPADEQQAILEGATRLATTAGAWGARKEVDAA